MDAKLIALIFAVVIGLLNMIIVVFKQFGKKPKIKQEAKLPSNPRRCEKNEEKIDKLDDDIGKLQVSMASLGASFKAFKEDNTEEHRRLFRKLNSSGG